MLTKYRKWSPLEHGGSVRKGKRKLTRFLYPKNPHHLVMRSSRARGRWSLSSGRNKGTIHLLLLDTADRYGIKILLYENVHNHLHILVKGRNRSALQKFFKVFPQRVMFHVTGARKGNPKGRFFDNIIWSRVVEWGPEMIRIREYFWKNALESLGFDRETIIAWRKASREVPL